MVAAVVHGLASSNLNVIFRRFPFSAAQVSEFVFLLTVSVDIGVTVGSIDELLWDPLRDEKQDEEHRGAKPPKKGNKKLPKTGN